MARPVRFTPGVDGAPEIEVLPDPFRGPRVTAAGRRIRMTRERGRPIFEIPMADGTTRPLRLRGGFLGLAATFEDESYTIEPPLQLWETFLVVLPLSILALGFDAPTIAGTVVAAVIAAFAVGIALLAIRAARPAWLRALWAIGVTVVGYILAGLVAASI